MVVVVGRRRQVRVLRLLLHPFLFLLFHSQLLQEEKGKEEGIDDGGGIAACCIEAGRPGSRRLR